MTTDYKTTLNLPTTDFAMKANLPEREPKLLEQWAEKDIYRALREHCKGREKFILHDGPPYANGRLHMGHVMNKVLKDIVVKSKTLSNYDAPFVPGWDCHGLPIELNVEKVVGKAGHKISAKEFRQKCREYAASQIELQKEDFKRLGIIGDWDHPYRTMDYQFEADVVRSLGKIIQAGHLHQGHKPVHWCMDCGSALAEAEVEYKDKVSPSIDVLFTALDAELVLKKFETVLQKKGPVSIVIWTTTPWTLPANQAVALRADLDYVLVECELHGQTSYLILAEGLLTQAMDRYGITDYHVHGKCIGQDLEGLLLAHPFEARNVPVILGDHVTLDSGTGCVHTAPSHGQDDYLVGLKYQLPLASCVAENGCYLSSVPHFAGTHVLKANPLVVALLGENNKLLASTELSHSYPHCWRHKTPLIFLATPQWFISMDQKRLREQALEEIKKIQWIPAWGEARLSNMIDQRPDWCISRQRSWGVPLPLLVHKETKKLHPRTQEFIEIIAKKIEIDGVDAWFDLDVAELIGEEAVQYRKLTDVLDVWFDSGVTHEAVLRKNKDLQFPADLYLEGSDQHRGWFQSSLLSSVAMNDTAPYKAVLTHGYAVDAQGRKMSKSIGNVVLPEKVVKTSGAEILRLWVASTDYHNEVRISDEVFKRLGDMYRRIRNTARFLLSNINDFDPAVNQVSPEKMLALDAWIVDRARRLQDEIIAHYAAYDFHAVTQKIHNFCTIELGSFYLDIIKDRQYTMKVNSLGRRSAQTAMYHIIEALTRWIAPVLTFTAEEIWSFLPKLKETRPDSVFFATWYEELAALKDTELDDEFWEEMMFIREVVNKELEVARNEGKIGSGLEAEVDVSLRYDLINTRMSMRELRNKNILHPNNIGTQINYISKLKQKIKKIEAELRFILITSKANVKILDKEETIALGDKNGIVIIPSSHPKCARCWHRCEDVGEHAEHPELCVRCVKNVEPGEGEERRFA